MLQGAGLLLHLAPGLLLPVSSGSATSAAVSATVVLSVSLILLFLELDQLLGLLELHQILELYCICHLHLAELLVHCCHPLLLALYGLGHQSLLGVGGRVFTSKVLYRCVECYVLVGLLFCIAPETILLSRWGCLLP